MTETTVETEKQTFELTLPTFFEEQFDKKFKTLNSKCKRHKLPMATVTKGKVFIKEIEKTKPNSVGGRTKTGEFDKYPCIPVTVEFEEIRVEGDWRVVASVEVVEGTDFRVVNGMLDDVSQYKDLDFYHCDHCGVRRFRKKIIIVENPKGERKVVGRSCMKDYIGISPAALVANLDLSAWLAYWSTMEYCDGDDERCGGGWAKPELPSIEMIAALTVAVMRRDKWNYFKSQWGNDFGYDDNQEVPTSHVVGELHFASTSPHAKKAQREWASEMLANSKEDSEIAEKAIAILKERFPESKLDEDLNSFEYNLVVMMATGKSVKDGILIGALSRPIREINMPVKKSKVDSSKSEYIGKPKDKVELEVIWDRFKWIEGYDFSGYGSGKDVLICTGHVNGTNDIVTWFSNNEGGNVVNFKDDDYVTALVDGEVVKIKATIKGHKDGGKYGKSTMLNRVKGIK